MGHLLFLLDPFRLLALLPPVVPLPPIVLLPPIVTLIPVGSLPHAVPSFLYLIPGRLILGRRTNFNHPTLLTFLSQKCHRFPNTLSDIRFSSAGLASTIRSSRISSFDYIYI
jgi:hypothetical protein